MDSTPVMLRCNSEGLDALSSHFARNHLVEDCNALRSRASSLDGESTDCSVASDFGAPSRHTTSEDSTWCPIYSTDAGFSRFKKVESCNNLAEKSSLQVESCNEIAESIASQVESCNDIAPFSVELLIESADAGFRRFFKVESCNDIASFTGGLQKADISPLQDLLSYRRVGFFFNTLLYVPKPLLTILGALSIESTDAGFCRLSRVESCNELLVHEDLDPARGHSVESADTSFPSALLSVDSSSTGSSASSEHHQASGP